MSMCPSSYNTTLEAGDATRNATVWLFWRSNRNHTLLVLVIMRALATSIHPCTYVPTNQNSTNKCTTMIPTAGPCFFLPLTFFNLGQHMTPIWKQCLAKFYCITLSKHQDPKTDRRLPFQIQKLHFSLVSLSPHPRSRQGAERMRHGEGRWHRHPKTALERSDLVEKIQFRESRTEAETEKTPDQIPVPLKKRLITIRYRFRAVHAAAAIPTHPRPQRPLLHPPPAPSPRPSTTRIANPYIYAT